MSQLEDWIRDALRASGDEPDDEPLSSELANRFLLHSRWATGFAWMKMFVTMTFAIISAIAFFSVESTRAQIAWATACLFGFIGFSIWWLWYWMVLNRNATLRELKRVELQIAELAAKQQPVD